MNKKSIFTLIVCILFLAMSGCDQGPNFYRGNFQILAVNGEPVWGEVYHTRYNSNAPSGWAIYYSFRLSNGNEFKGMSMGPKDNVTKFKLGSKIAIVYLPEDPRMNLELYYLVNCPSYKDVRKQAFLNEKFKVFLKGISVYDYTTEEWWHETRENNPNEN